MTAKEAFLKSAYRAEFEKITESAAFEHALHFALMVLNEEQPHSDFSLERGWDSHSRMIGARRLTEILRTLHTPDKIPQPVKVPTLRQI